MFDSLGVPLILLRIRIAVADGAVCWCAVLVSVLIRARQRPILERRADHHARLEQHTSTHQACDRCLQSHTSRIRASALDRESNIDRPASSTLIFSVGGDKSNLNIRPTPLRAQQGFGRHLCLTRMCHYITIWPRTRVMTGQPVTSQPSYTDQGVTACAEALW